MGEGSSLLESFIVKVCRDAAVVSIPHIFMPVLLLKVVSVEHVAYPRPCLILCHPFLGDYYRFNSASHFFFEGCIIPSLYCYLVKINFIYLLITFDCIPSLCNFKKLLIVCCCWNPLWPAFAEYFIKYSINSFKNHSHFI